YFSVGEQRALALARLSEMGEEGRTTLQAMYRSGEAISPQARIILQSMAERGFPVADQLGRPFRQTLEACAYAAASLPGERRGGGLPDVLKGCGREGADQLAAATSAHRHDSTVVVVYEIARALRGMRHPAALGTAIDVALDEGASSVARQYAVQQMCGGSRPRCGYPIRGTSRVRLPGPAGPS
ncbi:MAG TPA: hypothetical protein VF705_03580, partial [Longimicrobium sp.]